MIVTSYPFIDASTEDYKEEEVIYEKEEEHFDNYTTQGKLLPIQAPLIQAIPLQDTLTILLCLRICPSPSFYLAIFYFGYQGLFLELSLV